jgi:hypothetical protein
MSGVCSYAHITAGGSLKVALFSVVRTAVAQLRSVSAHKLVDTFEQSIHTTSHTSAATAGVMVTKPLQSRVHYPITNNRLSVSIY